MWKKSITAERRRVRWVSSSWRESAARSAARSARRRRGVDWEGARGPAGEGGRWVQKERRASRRERVVERSRRGEGDDDDEDDDGDEDDEHHDATSADEASRNALVSLYKPSADPSAPRMPEIATSSSASDKHDSNSVDETPGDTACVSARYNAQLATCGSRGRWRVRRERRAGRREN